ncbi:hypothetical protein [Thermogutta sp.]|uniref:hypothetical protein n=1 Tax=Thermogutta sp. TaxID=1962930 RepID=UPI00321FAFC3
MNIRPVQTGPVYRCWVCQRPAAGIMDFRTAMGGPTVLDRYADYIGYLDLDRICRQQMHPSRVARLGNLVTPLHFPKGCTVEERIQAIQDAVQFLLEQPQENLADQMMREIARIIHLVYVGTIHPDKAMGLVRLILTMKAEEMEVRHEMSMVW